MTDGPSLNSRQASGGLGVRTARLHHTTELILSGELDLSSANALRETLTRTLEQLAGSPASPTRRLILDARQLTFVDSSGITVLVSAKRRCLECEIDLELRLGNSQVCRTLGLAGVADFLGIQ